MRIIIFLITSLLSLVTLAQPADTHLQAKTFQNDLLGTKMYTLSNGMNLWITVNKNEPRLQTMIAVKAGSKNDPADHTGLAHYLEHMLFKGTTRYGTLDYTKEKVYLDQIESLYEKYGAEKDELKRKAIYHQIDSISGVAATFAIANEYDKMLSNLGAKGTNAFTSNDQTVYVNDIPANQLEKWMKVEGERFREPVIRLFHTELEAVYEEKNRTLDNDGRKVNEAMMASLFKNHAYGTQTTIGTIEHLKSPSITAIKKFYSENYVPNNMCIVLSGDVDPDKTAALAEKYFGQLTPKPVKPYTALPESPAPPREITIMGPDAEYVQMAYRLPGSYTREYYLLQLVDNIMSNNTAGMLDLNLKKKQLVLDASSGIWNLKDYCVFMLTATPKQGQQLNACAALLREQVDKLKNGEFDESLLPAIIDNMKVQELKSFESNRGRASTLQTLFTLGADYASYLNRYQTLASFTKADVMRFATQYFNTDYVTIYKQTGDDKNTVKVVKPEIHPVAVNRNAQSDFVKEVLAMPVENILPKFVDYNKDITKLKLKNGLPVWYIHNNENQLFSLYYVFDMGTQHNKKLGTAINYLEYLGTDKMTAEKVSTAFYNLACTFDVNVSRDQVYVSLSGLQINMDKGVALFEDLINHCQPDQAALDNMISGIMKERDDAKKSKAIVRQRLLDYANYGSDNPSTYLLTNEQLKQLTGAELCEIIHSLKNTEHKVFYYGPNDGAGLVSTLNNLHQVADKPLPTPPIHEFNHCDMTSPQVYFVDYKMVQSEINWTYKSIPWSPEKAPVIALFNEYFGGSMSSIVFQTIRESKALAYSTNASYSMPSRKEDPFYMTAYVGSQADKLNDAVPAMNELLNEIPESANMFGAAQKSIINQINTERILKTAIFFNYQSALKRNVDHDLRKDIYEKVPTMNFADIKKFHADNVKAKPYNYCVVASKNKVKLEDLAKFGTVHELTLNEIFGY